MIQKTNDDTIVIVPADTATRIIERYMFLLSLMRYADREIYCETDDDMNIVSIVIRFADYRRVANSFFSVEHVDADNIVGMWAQEKSLWPAVRLTMDVITDGKPYVVGGISIA